MPSDRLFVRLPGHIRVRDAENGYPLRALLAVAETELDLLHGDIAQLYDNWFIETCEEWVVPYIGDLLGARRLNPAGGDAFSLRAYVANTLTYRRAKGTAAVVEQLARDVTAWPARVVEYWALLIQSQHVNHVRARDFQTVDIRDTDRAAQVGTPFDPWAHTLEVRPIAKREGRYAIPNVGVFLWRLLAAPIGFAFDDPADNMGGVVPRALPAADGRFHFHPAGFDAPLFNRPRGEVAIAHQAEERDLPTPLRRLPLFQELVSRRAGSTDPTGYFGAQPVLRIRLGGDLLPPERLFVAHLGEQTGGGWRRPAAAGEVMFDPELGRISLHPADAARPLEVSHAFGAPAEIGAGPWDRRESSAVWLAPFREDAPGPDSFIVSVTRRAAEHTANRDNGGPCVGSLSEAIDLWNATGNAAGVRGVIAILDNATYAEALAPVALASGAQLAVMAAEWPVTVEESGARRRFVSTIVPAGRRPFVDAGLTVVGADQHAGLILDGAMFSGGIQAQGQLGALGLHYCTIGASATGLTGGIAGAAGTEIGTITVSRSVLGPVALPATVANIRVEDSIIGEDRVADDGAGILSTAMALDAPDTDVAIARATLFGRVAARTADIDGAIIAGRVRAARRQEGCVRYSLIPLGSRTAPRFRCQPDLALEAATAALRQQTGDKAAQLTDARAAEVARTVLPRFTATRFEHPAFAQLSGLCPAGIGGGGEGGAEMGAYGRFAAPIRLANLHAALADTLRVSLEAGLFTVI
jgi:hypothetical protein